MPQHWWHLQSQAVSSVDWSDFEPESCPLIKENSSLQQECEKYFAGQSPQQTPTQNHQARGDLWFTKNQCVCIFNLIREGLGSRPTFDQVVAYIVASGRNRQKLLLCIQSNPQNEQRVLEGYQREPG